MVEHNAALFALVGIGGILAGFAGALTGLGGGVLLVPLLSLGLGIDIKYAIGAALISVIATSSGAAVTNVRHGYTNVRVAMFLEVATTFGAIGGAYLAGIATTRALSVIFGMVLLYSAYVSLQDNGDRPIAWTPHPWALRLKLNGAYPTEHGMARYNVANVPAGFGLMVIAGVLSGLLGIGSGAMKVLAMDHAMRLPFKVSATTSNFMIGVTAAASSAIYFQRGQIDPGLAAPVVLGVLAGSEIGARVLHHAKAPWLRAIFGVVVGVLAVEMIVFGILEKIG